MPTQIGFSRSISGRIGFVPLYLFVKVYAWRYIVCFETRLPVRMALNNVLFAFGPSGAFLFNAPKMWKMYEK